jgi:glycosyltransferase involved in cell wall biosynthesis
VIEQPTATLLLGEFGFDEYVIFLDRGDHLVPRWRDILTETLGDRRPGFLTWGAILVGPDGIVQDVEAGSPARGSYAVHRRLIREQGRERRGAGRRPGQDEDVFLVPRLISRRGPGANGLAVPAHPEETAERRPGLVSVIVPLFRGAALLRDQLEALARQTYTGPWEVIFADNGSDDGSEEIARKWNAPVKARLVQARLPGPSHARNRGWQAATGDLLLFTDQDDVVAPDWIKEMVAASADADAVGGSLDTSRLNDPVTRRQRVVPESSLFRIDGRSLPFASSNNFGVWRDALVAVGGWHEGYPSGQDAEISWRLQLSGYRLVFAPRAVVHYRFRTQMAAWLRQTRRYAADTVRLYGDYRWAGAPRRSGAVALKAWGLLMLRSPDLFRGRAKRARWLRTLVRYLSFLGASVRQGVFHP